jgi:hypothetical protein
MAGAAMFFFFLSLHYHIQTSSGAHPASYPVGTWVKWPGHEADHTLPSSAKVNNEWSYTSIP